MECGRGKKGVGSLLLPGPGARAALGLGELSYPCQDNLPSSSWRSSLWSTIRLRRLRAHATETGAGKADIRAADARRRA